MSGSRTILDQAQSLARIEDLEADPGLFARAVADELPSPPAFLDEGREQPFAAALAELEVREHALATALAHIDATISRVMRVRLDHALAADSSIAAPTRNVFASTIGKYAGDLRLLAERVRDIAARGGSRDPDTTSDLVVGAARAALALREALRAPLLALVREHATSLVPGAERHALDRRLDDVQRTKWSALRRDLETVAARPEHIANAPLATRIAALPAQLDEPPAGPEVSFADLIEMD